MTEAVSSEVKFARLVFVIAGVWGVLVLTPAYFFYDGGGGKSAAAISHPEFY